MIAEGNSSQPPQRSQRLRLILAAVVIIIGLTALVYWLTSRGWEATTDAQIEGNLVPISARVSGYVDEISAQDNQQVNAGDVLVLLDRRDLEARLHSAEAAYELQLAQSSAAKAQVTVTTRTATSGEEQAGASVAATGTQIAGAQAQAGSAQAAADAARDNVTAAGSGVTTAVAAVAAAQAGVLAAEADVTSAEAQAKRAHTDALRFQQLVSSGAISKEQFDTAEATDISAQAAHNAARQRADAARAALQQAAAAKVAAESGLRQAELRAVSSQKLADQAAAGVRVARAALDEAKARLSAASTAPQQIAISEHGSRAAAARALAAEADLRSARLLLSYTRITAPIAGIVSQKSVEPGQYVQPGQLLMAVVPLENVWVVANFKETQIERMQPGQRADIVGGHLPGVTLKGSVESIGAATGAKFSLLPPENATGNFVKVVQRIPVKIVFDRPLPEGIVLRPGMNVVARVRS